MQVRTSKSCPNSHIQKKSLNTSFNRKSQRKLGQFVFCEICIIRNNHHRRESWSQLNDAIISLRFGMIHTSIRYSKFIHNCGNFNKRIDTKLVDVGLKRWEIGDIASRIGQLYFGQYMRTSDASYLSESYIFYEAILTREYFKDGLLQDLNLAHKQLRFFARFLTVCLVFNRREMVYQLVNQLKMLVANCKRNFQIFGSKLKFSEIVQMCLGCPNSSDFFQLCVNQIGNKKQGETFKCNSTTEVTPNGQIK